MFEVIISQLRTGRVERKQFGTREEAEQYLLRAEQKLLTPRPRQKRIPSLRDYRLEIQYRVCSSVAVEALPLPQLRPAA